MNAWRVTPAGTANRITDGAWQYAPHLALLSRLLVDVAAGRIKRLAVQCPPRHGKSLLSSWAFPLWYLANFPDKRVILASHGADFAAGWGRRVRNSMMRHGELLHARLAADSTAADQWNTEQGGGMYTFGVGGGIMGHGADVLIGDDTIKDFEQASSAVYRDRLWEWWQSTALTRLEPNGGVVLVNTRWHEDDLIGRILADERSVRQWTILRLPAIAGPDDPLGRQVGEALWPARYAVEALKEIQRESGQYVWDALYQQVPPPLRGSALYGAFDPTEGQNVDKRVELVSGIPLQMSVDFNRTPGMHAVLGQHFPKEDLLTARRVIHGPRMHIKAMVEELSRMLTSGELREHKFPHVDVFGDATGAISQFSDGQTSWQYLAGQLRFHGIPFVMQVPQRSPGVFDRVMSTNAAFAAPDGRIRYKIHPDCTELIRDFKTMKSDEQGKPNKKDEILSHASDAEGYRIFWLMPIQPPEKQRGSAPVLISR